MPFPATTTQLTEKFILFPRPHLVPIGGKVSDPLPSIPLIGLQTAFNDTQVLSKGKPGQRSCFDTDEKCKRTKAAGNLTSGFTRGNWLLGKILIPQRINDILIHRPNLLDCYDLAATQHPPREASFKSQAIQFVNIWLDYSKLNDINGMLTEPSEWKDADASIRRRCMKATRIRKSKSLTLGKPGID